MPFDRGIRVAGGLVLLGLTIELLTMFWSHPTSIIWYMTFGGGCLAMGVLYYVLLLVWGKRDE
jgi:hypothetical protein